MTPFSTMTGATTGMSRTLLHANVAVAACVALCVSTSAAADLPAVYKCVAAGGAVAYQDDPCQCAQIVDIKPDAADPAAIDRLRRANAAFDAASARREAERSAALRRDALEQRRLEFEAARRLPIPETEYAPAYAYVVPTERAHRSRAHLRIERRHVERRLPATIRRPQRN